MGTGVGFAFNNQLERLKERRSRERIGGTPRRRWRWRRMRGVDGLNRLLLLLLSYASTTMTMTAEVIDYHLRSTYIMTRQVPYRALCNDCLLLYEL
jgi:hypothetical protein